MAGGKRETSLRRLTVRRKPAQASRGVLVAGPLALPVALGRTGIKANKREGDGATPRGTFRLKRLWWRADRHPRPATRLPARRIDGERRLVRGSARPPLQPAGDARPAIERRPAQARRRPVRLHRRARPQHAAADRRPRQRRLYPCGAAGFCADRGLRRARCRRAAPAFGAHRPAHENYG